MAEARHFEKRTIAQIDQRAVLEYRYAPGGAIEIVDIEVGNEYRRTGVGRAMLNRLLEICENDTETVYAFTSQMNFIARDWYLAMGFSLIGLPGFYGGGEDAILCVKKVPKRPRAEGT